MRKQSLLLMIMLLLLSATACQRFSDSDAHSATNSQTQEQQQQTDRQENHESSRGELLFQDERVSIYAEENKLYTVTLVYGEYTQRLDEFNSLTPHCTTWEMDADNDGTNELYLIHTFGSGSGVSVQKLFVLEPNGDSLDIYCHDSKDIQAQFNNSCSGIYDPENPSIQMSYGESSYTCIIKDTAYRHYLVTATKYVLITGGQIHYTPTEDDTVQLSFNLSYQSDGLDLSLSSLPADAVVSCLIRFNGSGFELVEDLKFIYAEEHLWLLPEVSSAESMGYDEFFAEERAYHYPYSQWRTTWSAGEGELLASYGLSSDKDGFYIYKSHRNTPYYRIPNTADLTDWRVAVTNTRKLYCLAGGKILCIDVLSGERDTLYTTEYIPDMLLCHNDVLYFLAISDGILSLNRLYLPTMTLDVLYAQNAPEVPVSCYELYVPGSNQSIITWETINPTFWQAVTEILEEPESEYPELYYPAFTLDYLATHSIYNETVQHNFAFLQDVTGLRPRMKCYYDPVADTYTEKYGIYDSCFFGTGIHGDEEHFESYPEYRK